MKKCPDCASGAMALSKKEAQALLAKMPEWTLAGARAIRAEYVLKDFKEAIRLIGRIARLAEALDHHPDIHLTGYRRLALELSTHSIGGLSENDFILASRISHLPKKLKNNT